MLLRISDRIITNGYDTFEYYLKEFPEDREKVTIIENAVEFEQFSKLQIPNLYSKPIIISYIGRIAEAKGYEDFVKSVEIFKRKYSPFWKEIEFHVWGGDDKSFSKLIKFHGTFKRGDIYKILESCHGVVFLNKAGSAGGISHALLETMAAGRLIIAWNNFIHTQVVNTDSGILIPEGDIEKLADTYYNILVGNKNLFSKKCVNVRSKAKEFSVESHINKFLKILEKDFYLR